MEIRFTESNATQTIEVLHGDVSLGTVECAPLGESARTHITQRFAGMITQIPHDAPISHRRDYTTGFLRVIARYVGVA